VADLPKFTPVRSKQHDNIGVTAPWKIFFEGLRRKLIPTFESNESIKSGFQP
jgi:hypothetical protein